MKKLILSIILILSFAVNSASAVDFNTGVANGFVLPFGVQLTDKTFTDFSVSEKIGDVKVSLWKGESSDYEETDITVSYKNLTVGFFDIPGANNIVFTTYNFNGYVLKTLSPKGEKSGIHITKSFKLAEGFSVNCTAGTAPFSGSYLFTPGISYKQEVSEGLTISAGYKHPMGEVTESSAFDPSLIVKLNFSF